ncbi:hypothetical protein UlMin_018470 [Ulmus minor]
MSPLGSALLNSRPAQMTSISSTARSGSDMGQHPGIRDIHKRFPSELLPCWETPCSNSCHNTSSSVMNTLTSGDDDSPLDMILAWSHTTSEALHSEIAEFYLENEKKSKKNPMLNIQGKGKLVFLLFTLGVCFLIPSEKRTPLAPYPSWKKLINDAKWSVGLRNGKLLFRFEDNNYLEHPWGALDDIIMGGVSESVVSIANNGGFASIRTKNFSAPKDLFAYDGLELRLKGDGCHYKLVVQTSNECNAFGYATGFDITLLCFVFQVHLPFSSLKPIFRARSVTDAPPFDPKNVVSLQLMFSKFEYDGKLNPNFVKGPFQLLVSSIQAYLKDPISPNKQPPAVRLNKELGSILTFKLKGEDLIRESGIPYAIVRPCALTEEPVGADLIFDQGDNIIEEVARICIAGLESLYALDKTFEVKSVIPFSEPLTVDPENLPPEKDYNIYFKNLKDNITWKELLEKIPILV